MQAISCDLKSVQLADQPDQTGAAWASHISDLVLKSSIFVRRVKWNIFLVFSDMFHGKQAQNPSSLVIWAKSVILFFSVQWRIIKMTVWTTLWIIRIIMMGVLMLAKMFNHDKYLEKSISVGICQPHSLHSVETGQALTRWDLRPMSAITWTQLATLRGWREKQDKGFLRQHYSRNQRESQFLRMLSCTITWTQSATGDLPLLSIGDGEVSCSVFIIFCILNIIAWAWYEINLGQFWLL